MVNRDAPSARAHDELSALAGRRTALVVDDEEPIRQLISVMLELEGLRVFQADSGEAALEIAAHEELHLITLDVMMPGLDGWQVAATLDADPRTAVVPRIMVSGVPIAELRAAPGASRASAVLAKPFDFAEFTAIARGLLAQPVHVPAPRGGEV